MMPRLLLSGLAATLLLLAPAARASQDGEAAAEGIRLGSAVLRPYAYGQFDMGNAFAGRPTSPDGGVQTRRFRLGGEIDFSEDWMFSLIGDFGGEGQDGPRLSTARLYEAMLEYSGLAPFKLRVGAFEPGLTMEDSQTSASTLFLEQAAIVTLAGAIAGLFLPVTQFPNITPPSIRRSATAPWAPSACSAHASAMATTSGSGR